VWEDDPGGASLLIGDTYNHKVKRLDLLTGRVSTFLRGELSEPGGLAIARGELFVADTNSHRVRVADLATGETRTLEIDPNRHAHGGGH
jgi:sugar lactone lactonase YvrE